MSTGLNKVMLIGNLGQDPEVRYTQNGGAVCNLRVAVNERRKEGDEWIEHTEWVTVVCFGKTAENAGKYLAKGRQVFCEGRLQTRKWQDKKSGDDRYATEVVAFAIQFLGGKGEGDASGGGHRSGNGDRQPGGGGRERQGNGDRPRGGGGQQQEPIGGQQFYDDDLPF